jgi:Zn-dependent protease
MLEDVLNPRYIAVRWPVFLFSLSLHEFLHGWSAWRLGDPTAGEHGRLTLNPLAHYHPIGTTIGLLFGLGWAKPVPVNPQFFRWPRRDDLLVAIAGPLSNFGLAIAFTIAFKALQFIPAPAGVSAGRVLLYAEQAAAYGILLNLLLGFFNLVPVFPLDGFHVLSNLLNYEWAQRLQATQQYGMILLIVAVLLVGALASIPFGAYVVVAMTGEEADRLFFLLSRLGSL